MFSACWHFVMMKARGIQYQVFFTLINGSNLSFKFTWRWGWSLQNSTLNIRYRVYLIPLCVSTWNCVLEQKHVALHVWLLLSLLHATSCVFFFSCVHLMRFQELVHITSHHQNGDSHNMIQSYICLVVGC